MEKKTISVHAFTIHIYTVAIVLLLLLVAVLGLKYEHLKWAVRGYTTSTMWMNMQNRPNTQINDYGLIIAASSQQVPAVDLQTYVSWVSKDLRRDIVVLDSSKKVLADTVASNKGTTYNFDSNNEVKQTMADGIARGFQETSQDYPNGVSEVVVPVRNSKGVIVGAVLISNNQISQ